MSRSKRPAYVILRGDTYHFRFRVPDDLRVIVPRQEIKRSLQTRDPRVAHSEALRLGLKVSNVLTSARGLMSAADLDDHQIRHLVDGWLAEALEDDENHRVSRTRPSTRDELDDHDDAIGFLLSDVREQLASNDYRAISKHVDNLLEANNIPVARESSVYRKLCRELLKAHATALDVNLERNSGHYRPTLSSPANSSAVAVSNTKDSPLVSKLLPDYVKDGQNSGRWGRDKTALEYEAAIKLFVEAMGDLPVAEITRKTVREFRDTLAQLPANRTKKKEYRNRSIAELRAMQIDEPMAPRTVSKTIERLSSFLRWAVREELLDRNPAEGVTATSKRDKKETRYEPFTPEELRLLFHSREYTQGRHQHPYQFWVPLLGLHSGARLGELIQLHTADIVQEDDVWLMKIEDSEQSTTGDGDAKTVKTKAAIRRVPIHSKLIELGFLKYVDQLREKSESRVFPEVSKGPSGWSDYPSKWFTRYRRRCGVAVNQDRTKVFHSLRHNVITALIPKFAVATVQELVGHESGLITIDVYHHGTKATELQKLIEALDFGIEWQTLRPLSTTNLVGVLPVDC